MSVVNAFVQGNFAYLLTDMAWTDQETGRLLHVDSKFIRGMEPYPWGAAVTGNVHPQFVLIALEQHNPVTPTALSERLPAIMQTVMDMAVAAKIPTPRCAVAFAVYSRRLRAPTILACDMEGSTYGGLMSPMTAFTAEALVSSPSESDGLGAASSLLGRPVDIRDAASFDPEADGVALVAAQRSAYCWADVPGTVKAHRAGGGVQLMRVGRRGVTIKTLHTWPEDRVGDLIQPEAAELALT